MNQYAALDFCPELVRLYSAERLVTPSGREIAGGRGSSVNNLVVLRNLFQNLRPRRTMEVGLAYGASCLVFAASHKEAGAKPASQHVAVDPFQTSQWEKFGLLAVERAGLGGYVELREEMSGFQLPKMLQGGEQFELIYVDGSHIFEDVFVDAYYATRLLSEGGVIAFDDCRDAHVLKVVQFIRRNLRSSLEELDLSPYRADQGKSAKYRLARFAGRTQMTAFRRVGAITRAWNAPFHNF
jgi:predicted O-methyltransferase YrrM